MTRLSGKHILTNFRVAVTDRNKSCKGLTTEFYNQSNLEMVNLDKTILSGI